MSAMKISIRPVVSHEPIVRAMAHFILASSVLVVLFAGLFPFDFDFPRTGFWSTVRSKFDTSPEPPLVQDRIQNLLFFVPFGFGVGAALRPRSKRRAVAARLTVALMLGAALSLTIEVLQVFLGFRDPTWSDVVMNTLGAVVGAGVAVAFGQEILETVARPLARLRPYATLPVVTTLLVLYTAAQFAIPFRAGNRGLLDNWDVSFPLLVGNETVGERGWPGRVWQLDLASRAASAEEAAAIHAAGNARGVLADALLGSYELLGDGPYADVTGQLKPLTWTRPPEPADEFTAPATRPGAPPTSQPAHLTLDRWLRTPTAIAPATHKVRQTSQFTFVATVAPDETFLPGGPARIASISGGVTRRNFSAMHERRDLVLRLRTPLLGDDGSAPEALVDDVFESTDKRQIVVTYRDPLMVVYVDGAERGRLEITPEAEFIWRFYPRPRWKVRLGQYGFRSYALVYRLLVFIPFAALLAAATALSRTTPRAQFVIAGAAIAGVAVVLELIMGRMTASGFQPRNLIISLVIASVSFALMRVRRSRTPPLARA